MDQVHETAQLRLRPSDPTDLAGLAGGSWLYVAGETLTHPSPQHSGAKRKGNVYVQYQGESIKDLLIIRDTVTEVSGGETAWEYTADTGVVFDLSASASAVAEGQPPDRDAARQDGRVHRGARPSRPRHRVGRRPHRSDRSFRKLIPVGNCSATS